MWLRVLLVTAGLAGVLCGCAIVDPVDNRADTISRSLAKTRNEAIFLNLVRASHDYPMSFFTISNVTPTMTNTSSLALPSFLLGPHIGSYAASGAAANVPLFTPGRDVIFGNSTAGNVTAVGSNFNLSTEETSAFYQGFLRPIDLQTLAYFIRQGYSRELLFWLFTDSFELSAGGKSLGYHYNPPDDYGCPIVDPRHRCFIDWVHLAAYTGLTVEEKTSGGGGGGGSGGGGGGGKGGDSGGGGSSSGGKSSGKSYARFCFNQVLAQQAIAVVPPATVKKAQSDLDVPTSLLFSSQYRCGSNQWHPEALTGPQPDILPLALGPVSFTIVPRSAYGVFQFLGTLIKIQQEHIVPAPYANIPPSRQYAAEPPVLETYHEDPPLMTVVRNLGGTCFVHTWFEDGDYCVPDEATTTKRIFSLLAQLIAIETAPADLSITPIVRVIQ
jgi:uncharacterized membrane protein YgcG